MYRNYVNGNCKFHETEYTEEIGRKKIKKVDKIRL